MLHPEIQEFIEAIEEAKVIGCILVTDDDRDALLKALAEEQKARQEKSLPSLLSWTELDPDSSLEWTKVPALWIVSEEDYSENPPWAEKLRKQADYFLNVEE